MNTNRLRHISLVLVAFLMVMPVGWVSEIHAQAGPQGSQGAPAAGAMQQVEGKIKSVDSSGRMLTLEDGTQLTIPPTVNVPRGTLKEGAMVKASFEENGGQKIVTALEVRAGKQ